MDFFVPETSIVRRIWGKSDTILFIFAGASAEFALNKAVDWLYFTGKLPADPLGRLFSTVGYARNIVFAPKEEAEKTIDKITFIHKAVENARADLIPEWAYRDVLFMLIHYSIAAFELLERKLTSEEKQEAYSVFLRIGKRMNVTMLPATYEEWLPMRQMHLLNDLEKSMYTADLFHQYKKHLGSARYKVLKEAQVLVIPEHVRRLLGFKNYSLLSPVVPVYKFSRMLRVEWIIKKLLLPQDYQQQIKALDLVS
jgi:hypothetical protein